MEKQLVIIGIVAILVTVGFSGCTNNPLETEKNKFVGTWKMIEGNAGLSGATGDFVATYTFFSDGSVPIEHIGSSFSSSWKVKDGKLVINVGGDVPGSLAYAYDYSFSESNTILTLINSKGVQAVYQKQ
jgi:hypothetical protein